MFKTVLICITLLTISLSLLNTVNTKNINFEPIQKGEEAGLIFIQGADIPNDRYVPLVKKIQEEARTMKLYVSIANTLLNMPIPPVVGSMISSAKADLFKMGMSKSAKIYLAGHSLGGVSVSKYAFEEKKEFEGLILLGSFHDRGHRNQEAHTRSLTIGAEMDGLSRITRITEEFYHRSYDMINRVHIVNDSPNIIIKGMNHMQFASGKPSFWVKRNDLRAEISEEDAHQQVAALINAFFTHDNSLIEIGLLSTLELIKPIIESYELEGSIYFNRPDQNTCHRGYCGQGSEWVKRAQGIMSEEPVLEKHGVKLEVSNEYVVLSSLPPLGDLFHPKFILDKTTTPKKLLLKTYSQCSWGIVNKWVDGGIDYTSAIDIGSKMSSRQCSLRRAAGFPVDETPLTVDTEVPICAQINEDTYKWAINHVPDHTRKRFEQYGKKMNFIKDVVYGNGFQFTYTKLQFDNNKETGEVDIWSPAMVTDIDAKPIPIFAPDGLDCFHYCKLLSPARAVEWIYNDSLREKYAN